MFIKPSTQKNDRGSKKIVLSLVCLKWKLFHKELKSYIEVKQLFLQSGLCLVPIESYEFLCFFFLSMEAKVTSIVWQFFETLLVDLVEKETFCNWIYSFAQSESYLDRLVFHRKLMLKRKLFVDCYLINPKVRF